MNRNRKVLALRSEVVQLALQFRNAALLLSQLVGHLAASAFGRSHVFLDLIDALAKLIGVLERMDKA